MRFKNVVVVIGFLSIPSRSVAQELRAVVSVKSEAISSSSRDYLRGFQADVERYLNETKFSSEDMLGDKIDCSFEIFFTSATESRYVCQVVVGSQRKVYVSNEPTGQTSPILRVRDERWEFEYQPGQRMRQDDFSFDPVTDFLDFYAYIVIGLDLETYTPNAGGPYFQKALNICSLGASSESAAEWKVQTSPYNRHGLAEELTNPGYTLVHEAFTKYHFEGIDLRETDYSTAMENMLSAIETIAQVRKLQNPSSVWVRQFFNAKYLEIADSFSRYGDPDVFMRLGEYDQEHLSAYLERRAN